MKGSIPRSFIDDLVARTDIVELINSRVKLKKAGRDYQACCPFHHEKSPSFTVSQSKQFYHCFGCGAHGNAISFLMDYDKLEFPEAIEELAAMQGLEVPRENVMARDGKPQASYKTKRNLYELLEAISRFYQQNLTQDIPSQSYLQSRGLSPEIIARFEIGFAYNSMDSVLRKFGTNRDEVQKLFDTGMITQNDSGRIYDKFRNRVMFPIRDKRGRVIAFGGRVMGDERPKYLNSPESATYHKGNELYGLFQALQQNENPTSLVVVEGYMDVVALAQFGVDNVVASLGTATTGEQIQQMFRVTEQVICCYDGDRAGREAAWRAFENALPYLHDGRQLKFIFLPDGEDPDSFVRAQGKQGFEAYLQNAMSLSDFLFDSLIAQVDLSSKEGKSKLAALAIPLINRIPGEMLRVYLRNILGQKLGILDPAQLEAMLPSRSQAVQKKAVQTPQIKRTPMRLLIALLLQNPELVKFVPDISALKTLEEPGFELLLELVEVCRQKVGVSMGALLEHWRDKPNYRTLELLADWEHLVTSENIETTFIETLDFLYAKLVEKRIEVLIAKDRSLGLSAEEKQELVMLIAQ
ncbi:putative DNA primase [Actinobacillus pleuropneumoniae]|uniref:DNA primase n=1 Tax=Actinobacillus pleuropneumoniae TaxID=715 RepID=UPI0001E49160|nr:DNA primase [Actinobacillus pleuropneumoniae]EFN00184.1 DNA primase [Actinobacillus pleuropneumoniae serovar 12 str. 1096]KIE89567.1 putative DNA primase [Actinobacillus pleuropneumoniae]KIE89600.1 putative DNA primase [Actinobacillus pleuropneumoniae]KIE89634.1 putative DNA primase [Actinobacillus pleuropneumoniae]KIE94900.1 putative DNA primase [Actinobacillus pleuropneumoniae]